MDRGAAYTLSSSTARTLARYNAWANRTIFDAVDALPQAAFDEQVRFDLISGNQSVMTRGEILLHVVNHTSYHRGFVADLFFQVPARPPLTDLPIFLRQSAES